MHNKLSLSENRKDRLETYSTLQAHIALINMADAGLPAPPLLPSDPSPQALQALQQPIQPVYRPKSTSPAQPIQHVLQLNWAHFKPEFAEKPEENAEGHLLRTNDLMDTHAFQEV